MLNIIKTENWTYEEMVAKLPAESRVELRNNQLIEMPAPKPKHQRIITNFYDLFKPYIKSQNLGIIFIAPLDVVFNKGNSVQPDIIFVANHQKNIVKENFIAGVPELLVEVVSKGSVARDYIEKKNDYEKFGVLEYWIIDSLNETIWVYVQNNDKKLELFSYAEAEEIAKSKLLDAFVVKHEDIFEE